VSSATISHRLLCPGLGLLACFGPPAGAAAVPVPDVLLKSEVELYGVAMGLTARSLRVQRWQGHGAFGHGAGGRALRLAPGQYTLLLRTRAPAGDQDGFCIEINGVRTRRVARVGRWMTIALPFSVAKEDAVQFSLIGEEPGPVVDLLAVVARHLQG